MSKLVRALLAALLLVAGVTVFAVAPASAAESLEVRKVDTSNFPDVNLTVLRPSGASGADPVQVTENGNPVSARTQTMTEAGNGVGVVLVLDNSSALNERGALDATKAAAVAMVENKAPNERYGVVASNNGARTVVNLTDNKQLLIDAINNLSASGDSGLYRGLQLAGGMLNEAPTLQHNVVALGVSPDRLSPTGTYTNALSELRGANAVAFSVALNANDTPDKANLQDLAAQTKGRFVEVAEPGGLSAALGTIGRDLSAQAVVSYRSTASGALDIKLASGGATGQVSTGANTVSEGSQVDVPEAGSRVAPSFLTGTTGMIVVAVITLLGAGVLLYGLVEVFGKDRRQLQSALRPYSDEPEEEKTDIRRMADSAIIKKAVERTAEIAEERGVLDKVQLRLEQADLPLKPAEALLGTVVVAGVGMLLGAAFQGFLGLVGAGLVFGFLPVFFTGMRARRRRRKFTSQLPDTLSLLAGSLRAGYSLVQGMDAVAKQAPMPMAGELQRAMAEARLGRPIEEALQEVSDRMGSDDFEWTVMAIKIQREVGGNLAELLMTVSETMINRERLRREVKALTAEGRISAIVLSLLPPGIGAVISVMNPSYMQPLFHDFLGQIALVAAGVMIGLGYWAMTKLSHVEA